MRTVLCIAFACSFTAGGAAQERPKTIHVFVALCDNEHQGIVPVPAALGNGEDPANNLYWGALYGMKTFLKKSTDWTLVKTVKSPTETVLERIVLEHKAGAAYLIADAYRGARIKEAVTHFLGAAAGNSRTTIRVDEKSLRIHGAADLVVYVGHNGLMDAEFTWMLPYYYLIADFYLRPEFGAVVKASRQNRDLWRQACLESSFDGRGQLGEYWASIQANLKNRRDTQR